MYTPGNAPVYNPNAAVEAILPSQVNNPGYLVTQTVYGFLDFTTTIGNTVMIFSPQSAAPAVTGKRSSTPRQNFGSWFFNVSFQSPRRRHRQRR